jgi:hypothetical protein
MRSDYLPFEFVHGFRKVGAVVDTPDELTMRGTAGEVLLNGRMEIVSLDDVQSDPALPPREMATIRYTYRTPDGGRKSYTVVQPAERLGTEFDALVQEILPPGTPVNNRGGNLLVAVLALSDDGQKHRVPVMTADTWMDANGLYDHARRICDAPVEIVSESKNQFGETLYRLRVPRSDDSGDFDYTTTTFDGLNNGALRFGTRSINIYDGVRTGMALRGRYQNLTDADRERFVRDEVAQLKREHDVKVSRMFLIGGRRPDGRMPDGSLPR